MKTPTAKPAAHVEDMKQLVQEKKRSLIEKRKSIQEKRKSVGPKTWASVASKLSNTPWKSAGTRGTIKLPPKTPLRQRAIKAMTKTAAVKTGVKRKSTGKYYY